MASNPEQFGKELKKAIADFINREAHRGAMITVTSIDLSPDTKYADILITTLPDSAEKSALEFVTRHKDDIRRSVMKAMRHRFIPYLRFHIDEGDKKRSHLMQMMEENKSAGKNISVDDEQ